MALSAIGPISESNTFNRLNGAASVASAGCSKHRDRSGRNMPFRAYRTLAFASHRAETVIPAFRPVSDFDR
jgi:hypothetical protein